MIRPRLRLVDLLVFAAWLALAPAPARANCNLIPAAPDEFRSTQGMVGNAVVAPGNPVRVRVDLACDPGAPGFSPDPAENQVTLRFLPPGAGSDPSLVTEVAVPPGAVGVANCAQGGGRCDTLRFVVPGPADLDAALPPLDGLGPAGPAEIVVRGPDASVLARIGPLYEPTLACDDRQPEAVFGHFTVLPEPNEFAALEQGAVTTVRATLDGNGNLLIPFDYSGVLPGGPGSAVFRILQGTADVPAFSSNPALPLRVPAAPWVRSFSLTGRPIPPVLEVDAEGALVLGSVDAVLSLLRISRVDPFTGAGPPLYDFTDRFSVGGRGPILIENVLAASRESAPLETLVSDPEGIAFARVEFFDGDLNGDDEPYDRVPQVVDVATGTSFSTQQAVAEVSVPGYAKPALATGSGLVAMATSEARHHGLPINGDGDAFDSILRVFRTSGVEVTQALPPTPVDPLPQVNGRTLAVSGPYVFFRTREADAAQRSTINATPVLVNEMARGHSDSPALSGDGRYLVFRSAGAQTFVPGVSEPEHSIWLLDRQTGVYERITRDELGDPMSGMPSDPGISADGRYVVYVSDTEAFPGAADGGLPDVFLYDRETQTTVCASCQPFLTEPATDPDISADGRWVVFNSNGLMRWDRVTQDVQFVLQGVPTGCEPDPCALLPMGRPSISGDGSRIAVRTRLVYLPTNTLLTDQVMVFEPGQPNVRFVAPGENPEISADGNAIVLQTDVALVTDDNNLATDAYVIDLDAGVDLVSQPTAGLDSIEGSGGLVPRRSAISDDGRYAAFVFDSVPLAPGVQTLRTVYRYDRATNVIEALAVDSAGTTNADGFMNSIALSGDGRVAAFSGFASNLAPDTFPDVESVFVREEAAAPSLNAADADASDTVLQVLDTSAAPPALRANARVPAEAIAVDGPRAAFLSSEAADGGVDRNGDGDTADRVARAYDAATDQLHELGVAATRIDVAGDTVCLTIPESGEPNPAYHNGDGDVLDDVVAVWSFAQGGAPVSLGVSAVAIQAVPGGCVFLTSEQDDELDLNGDGDDFDTVLRHWDGTQIRETGLAAADFVARGDLVAFRVCEFAQGSTPLNGDGEDFECVMHVLRRSTNEVKNTGRAADRCEIPGCDPFFEPYRVGERTVSFLTRELAQGSFAGPPGLGCAPVETGGTCDLNGDGDGDDVLISVYGVESEKTQVITLGDDGPPPPQPAPPFPTEQSGRIVLQVVVPESSTGEDVNGDGQITDDPVLILVGDADNDGSLDVDSAGQRDLCVEAANPDQADADRDQLGDGACDPAPTPALPGDVPCDVDLDGVIDADDVALVFGDRGMAARGSDPRDPDGDGVVTVLDASICSRSCTFTDCAAAPPAAARRCGALGAEVLPLLGAIRVWRRRARSRKGS